MLKVVLELLSAAQFRLRAIYVSGAMNVKRLKSLLIPIFLVLPVICWIAFSIYHTRKHYLPTRVDTLTKFNAGMPKPDRVIVFEKDGSKYVEVVGPRPRLPTISPPSSGPPVYIFDSAGRIRYWTIDSGESPDYWEEWQNRSNNREVSMQDALNLTERISTLPDR